MVDQEIRVLGDENIIANPKNSQKQYPLTFKAVPNVIVYGRKKADLNFTVPITEGTNFNFNLERTAIIFSDSFNLEEYSYIMVKNPFEEISDFFYVSSLEELDPTGKEFNEFNDEVVKWLRRLVNIISNRCMIFETTLFKDLNNFPNIKTGQTFIRTEDGWTGITIRDINSELDLIFNKYVEEINKKIQEHQTQMNELLEQWKQDIQKYAENVKQYEIVRIVTQTGHGFIFEPVMYSISQRKFVKALFPHGADGIAVRVDDNNFKLVWAGRVEIPATSKDTQQRDFILGEYYFLGEGSNGGVQREKPDTYYQHLFQVMYSDELRQNIADVLLSVPINQKGKRWDVGEAKTTVNDIEELKMSDFPVGKVVEVLGYYSAGDGAGHKRIIKAEDDGSGVQLNSGLWANIVHNGEINVLWLGCKKEDESFFTGNSELVNKITSKIGSCIFFPNGNFYFKNIIINDYVNLIGESRENTILIQSGVIENIGTTYLTNHSFIQGFEKSSTGTEQGNCYNSIRNLTITSSSSNGQSGINGIGFVSESGTTSEKTGDDNHIQILNCIVNGNEKFKNGLFIPGRYKECRVFNCLFRNCLERGLYQRGTDNWFDNISCFLNNIGATFYGGETRISNFKCFYNLNTGMELRGLHCLNNISLQENYQYGLWINSTASYIQINNIYLDTNGIHGGGEEKPNRETAHIKFGGNSNIVNIKNCTFGNFRISKPNGYNFADSIIRNGGHIGNILNLECVKTENPAPFENTPYDDFAIFNTLVLKINSVDKNSYYSFGNNKLFNNGIYGVIGEIHFGRDELNSFIEGYLIRSSLTEDKKVVIQFKIVRRNKEMKVYVKDIENNFGYREIGFSGQTQNEFVYLMATKTEENYTFKFDLINKSPDANLVFRDTNDSPWGESVSDLPTNSYPVFPTQLNTLYHMEKMKQENVYDDYITYMDEKTVYDKQQRKLEQDRQLAYEEALKENPNLTYDEFMSVQPMTLNLVEEPQPSDALKKFMEKYL